MRVGECYYKPKLKRRHVKSDYSSIHLHLITTIMVWRRSTQAYYFREVIFHLKKFIMKKPTYNRLLMMYLICATYMVSAQTEDVRDHYTTKLVGQFIAFDASLGALNTGFGYGFQLDGFVGNKLSAAVVYSKNGWTDINEGNGNNPETSLAFQGVDPAGYFQANVRFHLIDKMGMGKIKWERMGNHTGKMTTIPSGTVSTVYTSKGMVRKILAVRGGLYNWKSPVTPESDETWNVLPAGTSTPTIATDKYFTTLRSQNFSAGLTTGKLADVDRLGRHVSYLRWWFADVLINSSLSMDDIKYANGSTAVFQIGQADLQKQSIGWRVGFEWIALARKYITMGVRMEGGKRPAVTNREPYFQVVFGLGTKYATKQKQNTN